MPDSDGKIRGISIPSVPWHESENTTMQYEAMRAPGPLDRLLALGHQPKPALTSDLTSVESAVRDADQMLWDKQTKP